MSSTSEKRYTAVLKIVEIEKTQATTGTYRGGEVSPAVETDREVVKLEVRSKDLESLKAKLKAHIDLAEEL